MDKAEQNTKKEVDREGEDEERLRERDASECTISNSHVLRHTQPHSTLLRQRHTAWLLSPTILCAK